jgi:hypothetical protein
MKKHEEMMVDELRVALSNAERGRQEWRERARGAEGRLKNRPAPDNRRQDENFGRLLARAQLAEARLRSAEILLNAADKVLTVDFQAGRSTAKRGQPFEAERSLAWRLGYQAQTEIRLAKRANATFVTNNITIAKQVRDDGESESWPGRPGPGGP